MKGALVTGAARGLGKEIALTLAREGYAVAVNYRKSGRDARRTLKALRKINRNCTALKGDMARESDVRRTFSSAKRRMGRIDVLVNNVGDFLRKPLLKTTGKELTGVVGNNIATAFLCSREAVRVMKRQKHGRIINVGSVGCDEMLAPDFTTPYYIGKTGVFMLTKALARKAPEGVTVNMVSPGILRTSVVKPKGAAFTEMQEVASAVMMLISSSHNGKNLTIARWKPEG